jgi:hypothetical protein
MFESGYTQELIELGYQDAMEARETLLAFVHGEPLPSVAPGAGVAQSS